MVLLHLRCTPRLLSHICYLLPVHTYCHSSLVTSITSTSSTSYPLVDQALGYGDPGETDLLITWIYKMSMESGAEKNYAMACVLGVLVFLVIAVLSLIFYGRSNAVKNEEDFA